MTTAAGVDFPACFIIDLRSIQVPLLAGGDQLFVIRA